MKAHHYFLLTSALIASDFPVVEAADAPARIAGRSITASQRVPAQTVREVYPPVDRRLPTMLEQDRHFYVSGNGFANLNFGAKGGTFRFGWQPGFLGADARITFASAQFRSIVPPPSESDTTNADFPGVNDDDSEINRVRKKTESWSFITYQPGVVVQGRAFPDWLPFLSQKARFGFGPGSYTDNVNKLSFSAWQATIEGTLSFQIKRGRVTIDAGGEWNFGRMVTTGGGPIFKRRLPISYFLATAGLSFWF